MNERAGRALAQAYGRADSRTRLAIASALHALGTSLREAVEVEARQLWEQNARELRGGSATARAGAAEELGRSGRAEAVRLLVELLEDEASDPLLAAAAARGLGMSGDRTAVEPLEAALFGRPASVSEAAAWALGRIGDPQAAGSLADLGSRAPSRLACERRRRPRRLSSRTRRRACPCARSRSARSDPAVTGGGRRRGARQGRRLPRAPPRAEDRPGRGRGDRGAGRSRRPPPPARPAPGARREGGRAALRQHRRRRSQLRPRVPWGSLRSRRPSPPCSGASPR